MSWKIDWRWVAFLLLIAYAVGWVCAFGFTDNVTIQAYDYSEQRSISEAQPITLPFLQRSEAMASPFGNFYIIKGDIVLPPVFTADTLTIKTDDCPGSLIINGREVTLNHVPPLQAGCNFQKNAFSFAISQLPLTSGRNTFSILINDIGQQFGVSLKIKSVLLKKSLLFVVPLLFIGLFICFFGITRRDLFSIYTLLAAIFVTAGIFAISLSYEKLCQTLDEPAHISTGMEWWDKDSYTFEPLHPPLARAAVAALLYLSDNVPTPTEYGSNNFYTLGTVLLTRGGEYIRNLTLAKLGIIPFYLLGSCVVFMWSRRLFGRNTALLSLILYVLSPIVAGHAGLATTDMPYAAMFVTMLLAFCLWLEQPGIFNSVFLGGIAALTVATKLSVFMHFSAAALLIAGWHFFCLKKQEIKQQIPWRKAFRNTVCVAIPIFLLLLEVIYFFDHFHALTQGIKAVIDKNARGQALWMFEPLHDKSVWYYFAVGVFFKNPLPFWAFFIVGTTASWRFFKTTANHRVFFPLLAIIGVMVPSMLGNINIGTRHVLPVFLFMAITAGYGIKQMFVSQRFSHAGKIVAMLLLTWQLIGFIKSSPEYFTYFNEAAGEHPENIMFDSDLDWGQDLFYLEAAAKQNHIEELSLCYLGSAPVKRILSSTIIPCVWNNPSYKGWLAVSHNNRMLTPMRIWLADKPYIEVGRSIRLYHLE